MKKLTKLTNTANWRNGAVLMILAMLPACTKAPWDAEFWSPPTASGAAKIEDGSTYPIRRATGQGSQWPTLASVPTQRPLAPSTYAEQQAQQEQLEQDRASAAKAVADVKSGTGNVGIQNNIKIPDQPPKPPADLLPE